MKSKHLQIEEQYGLSMKEILITLYEKNYYSYKNIADFLGADSKSIRDWAKKAGVKSRSPREGEFCRRKEKLAPEFVLRQLLQHLSVCICPGCRIQKQCAKGEKWHAKGFCVMVCAEREPI